MTLAQARLVTEAKWWISHETLMDYAQTRPVPLGAISAHRKCATDCSGAVYGIWHSLGFDDPTGGDYTSQDIVYTGTLLTANERVGAVAWMVGDLAIFANSEGTTHVAFVIETGADPLLFSHGASAGPIAIRLSAEALWHREHGAPLVHHARTSLPPDKKRVLPTWRVTAGDGTRLGRTHFPKLWVARHHPFHGRHTVTFRRTD